MMGDTTEKGLSEKFYPRFGQIAVRRGFINEKQLNNALTEQVANDPSIRLRPNKLIGEIFLEKGLMSLNQIESVLAEISRDKQY
ncbi:MAG TPA: hypothetical protein ENG83_00420 [Nitrospirae bacterium]|nr:hypothetical protein BMS3Abin06_01414 [bacterium BMS3Abin06]HDH10667.1 hypothetical protein [Nitrospirota bacterium]HDZ01503.1 hypothetical protein [Nitrospirota bacterium]